MIYIKTSLFCFQIRRINICNRAVAIPLKVSNIRILFQQFVYDTVHIILHLRIAQVQHQLIAVIIRLTVRIMDCPIGMLFEQLALRIDHFRFNPKAKLHSFFLSSLYQGIDTTRKLVSRSFPVSQSCGIPATLVFVSKPSVIQQKHIHAEFLRFPNQIDQNILIEVESRIFPVVQ